MESGLATLSSCINNQTSNMTQQKQHADLISTDVAFNKEEKETSTVNSSSCYIAFYGAQC